MGDATHTQSELHAHYQAHEAEALAVKKSAWKTMALDPGEYIKESQEIVAYARSVWKAGPDGAPALQAGRAKCPPETLDRLSTLLAAFQYAHARELAEAHPVADIGPKAARAQFLINELDDALTFVLDDDIHEPADDKLDALQTTTKKQSKAGATLGQTLLAWGLFAQSERDRLSADAPDFDLSLVDEAIQLGTTLTSGKPLTPARRKELRNLRLGLYTLAYAEMQKLRKASNYVYRHHPDIKRKFTSALERKRRANSRLENKLNEVVAASPAT